MDVGHLRHTLHGDNKPSLMSSFNNYFQLTNTPQSIPAPPPTLAHGNFIGNGQLRSVGDNDKNDWNWGTTTRAAAAASCGVSVIRRHWERGKSPDFDRMAPNSIHVLDKVYLHNIPLMARM